METVLLLLHLPKIWSFLHRRLLQMVPQTWLLHRRLLQMVLPHF